MDRLVQENLDPIISLLYGGVTEADDWHDGIDAVREAMGGALFHCFSVDSVDHRVLEGFANYEAPLDKVREYEQVHARNDERMPVMMGMPAGGIMMDHEHFDARAMSRSAIYADWLASFGLGHSMGLMLRAGGGVKEVLGIMRPYGDAAFGEEEKAFCRRLMPHLVRASQLRARMSQLARHAAIGLSALDVLPQGLFVVDGQGRVQYANQAAARYLHAAGFVRMAHGRLHFGASEVQARFLQLASDACSQRTPATAGMLRVPLSTGPSLVLSVLPLNAGHPLAAFRPAHLALVVLADPNAALPVSGQMLAELLGLTPTEARLALALAAGKTVKNFATAETCSEHTARTHLKNLLRKTGCHRQAELIRLILSIQPA